MSGAAFSRRPSTEGLRMGNDQLIAGNDDPLDASDDLRDPGEQAPFVVVVRWSGNCRQYGGE